MSERTECTHLPETLQNVPAELPCVVCEQSVRRGNESHVYHARFWREAERMKMRALMVAAFGAAAVEAQRRQIRQMIRDAVGNNVLSTNKRD